MKSYTVCVFMVVCIVCAVCVAVVFAYLNDRRLSAKFIKQ